MEIDPLPIPADKIQPHDLRPTSKWEGLDGGKTVDLNGEPVSAALARMLREARSPKAVQDILRGTFTIVGDGYEPAKTPDPAPEDQPEAAPTEQPARS